MDLGWIAVSCLRFRWLDYKHTLTFCVSLSTSTSTSHLSLAHNRNLKSCQSNLHERCLSIWSLLAWAGAIVLYFRPNFPLTLIRACSLAPSTANQRISRYITALYDHITVATTNKRIGLTYARCSAFVMQHTTKRHTHTHT